MCRPFNRRLHGLAQQTDTAAYMVLYKFSHLRDTNNRATPYTENMALFLWQKLQCCTKAMISSSEDALFKKQVKEAMANST